MKRISTFLGRFFKGDTAIWFVFFAFVCISLIAVYSSIGLSAIEVSHSTPLRQFIKHAVFVGASVVIAALVSNINYRSFSKLSKYLYMISALVLLVMLVIGQGRFFYLGGFGFQPSEVAKIALIVFLARELAIRRDHLKESQTFVILLIYIGVIAGLILPENFSTAALVGLVCFLMMLIGGVDSKLWIKVFSGVVVVALLALFIFYHNYQKEKELANNYVKIETVDSQGDSDKLLGRSSTWGHRVDSWLNPDPDALTQENMARMAVARGKFWGCGIGNTIHARLVTQAHNDLIFAIIIEEAGMFMGIVIFVLYSWLYLRCFRVAGRCKGTFGSLTVAGLGTLIFIQALVNMSVAVGVLPITGQTLPMISYGGTAYLCMGLSIGMIQAVAADVRAKAKAEKEKNERERGFQEAYQVAVEENA